MGQQYLAIVNPAAGGGRCGRAAQGALASLQHAGLDLSIIETSASGEATQIARAAYARGVRRFIGVGGDGTSFEIINGLFPEALHSGERPWLGFLPLGTGNSFLRDFTHDGASYALGALREARHRPCDVIALRHKAGTLYFLNLLSFGFVADVCTVANRYFKGLGEAGYPLGVLWKVSALSCRPIPFALDGGAMCGDPLTFVSFCNSRFTGGKMMMAPSANAADGLCDVVVVHELGRVPLVRTFPSIFDGSHLKSPAVRAYQARSVAFQVHEPLDAMVDGEVIQVWPEELTVLSHALEVCV